MTILIEGPKWVQGQKRGYFAFWVRLIHGVVSIAISGFKYFPDKKTVSTPSAMKGEGRFVDTVKVTADTYNLILKEALRVFDTMEADGAEDDLVA